MKAFIYICNEEEFLKGNLPASLSIFDNENMDGYQRQGGGTYKLIKEVEIEDSLIDIESITASAVDEIEIREQEIRANFEAMLNELKDRKQNLLAITHERT